MAKKQRLLGIIFSAPLPPFLPSLRLSFLLFGAILQLAFFSAPLICYDDFFLSFSLSLSLLKTVSLLDNLQRRFDEF